MRSLLALTAVALTACAIAHPTVRQAVNDPLSEESPLEPPNRKFLREYLLPRYLRQHVPQYHHARIPQPHPQTPASDWLNEEINRINRMQDRTQQSPYKTEIPRWITHEPHKRILGPVGPYGIRSQDLPYFDYPQLWSSKSIMAAATTPKKHPKVLYQYIDTSTEEVDDNFEKKVIDENIIFALTPLDAGYFEPTEKDSLSQNKNANMLEGLHEGGGHQEMNGEHIDNVDEPGPRRPTRQNPNHSRSKSLVNGDMEILKEGLLKNEYRLPVSLMPSSLDWLKINKENPSSNSSDGADNKVRVFGTQFLSGSIYAIAVATAIGTAVLVAILGFIFAWYSLSKRAKAAADVDYPAYGVTGPTVDTSGDRKLAHSAQMYHYQHQKQQIIAMERCSADNARNGSVSDPESEEENEEGDYTVYECPGFATTGEMEVKNPLFTDQPTPATPGKCEIVKPQPKE